MGGRNALSQKTVFVNNFSKNDRVCTASLITAAATAAAGESEYLSPTNRRRLPDRINFIVHVSSRYDKRHPPPNSARRSLLLGPVAAPMPNRSRFAHAGPGCRWTSVRYYNFFFLSSTLWFAGVSRLAHATHVSRSSVARLPLTRHRECAPTQQRVR